MRDSFLLYGAPLIGEEEIAEVVAVLRSGWIGQGPRVKAFETAFAAYKQVPSAVAVNSCTSALHLSLMAAGIGPGDEVITTALTFCATANAIVHAGARPVVVDVDPLTYNIDPACVEAALTARTKAILVVHFAGRACDMARISAIAAPRGLVVIEDCAHAIETETAGQKAGTIGDYGCFSFYPTKSVTCGEGGAVLARDERQVERIRRLALHGMTRDAWKRTFDPAHIRYGVVDVGYKYNMTDIDAAIGVHQLARVERNWRRRDQIWVRYNAAFQDLPVVRPAPDEVRGRHARHLYTLRVDPVAAGLDRDAFIAGLAKHNIGTGIHYAALTEHPAYQERFGWRTSDTPVATQIGRQIVSLPLSAGLSDDDVADVITAVRAPFA